jgi:hypothetical protein
MSGRIRGHYRIDSRGQVQPLGDVNAAARPCTFPPASVSTQVKTRRSRLVRMMAYSAILAGLGLSLPGALPMMQRKLLAAEAAHYAAARQSYIQSHPELVALLAKHR